MTSNNVAVLSYDIQTILMVYPRSVEVSLTFDCVVLASARDGWCDK